ncbi:MAG: cobalamin biosynthesis protein [Magnetococcales bacterium]|nr:cobalamin biosynthesis protein [Magnetococcales bacterium]
MSSPLNNPRGDVKPALVAVTRRGAEHAARLRAGLWPEARLFVLDGVDGALTADRVLVRPLRAHIAELFRSCNPLVIFAALGVVVRLIAPELRSKREDPAVLAIDEGARFVIPVVSGHIGGANAHARALAAFFDATAVVTTASDVASLPAVDLLGQAWRWQVEAEPAALTWCAARVVNGDPVALLQESGSRRWREAWQPWPEHIEEIGTITQADPTRHQALLWITRQPLPEVARLLWQGRLVIYRPPPGQGEPLVLGIGCDRHTSLVTLAEALDRVLSARGLSLEDVIALTTLDLKGDEPAIRALASDRALPLHLFSAAQLAQVAVPNPSPTVAAHVGTPSVAEAAVLLLTGRRADDLLVTKQTWCGADGKNVTIALAPGPVVGRVAHV